MIICLTAFGIAAAWLAWQVSQEHLQVSVWLTERSATDETFTLVSVSKQATPAARTAKATSTACARVDRTNTANRVGM